MIGATMAKGRKRKPGVVRTKSGRISRAADAYQEDRVAIEARARLWGLSYEDAKQPHAETVIGRLYLIGQQMGGISVSQYDAAMKYREQREAYKRALGAPDSFVNASHGGIVASGDEERAKMDKSAIRAFDAVQRILVAENTEPTNRQHNLLAAMDYIVIRNEKHTHMFNALRVALNALVRYYGIRH